MSFVDRAQVEQWCELAEEWVLSTLASIALSRSAELAARSDLHVRVVQAAAPSAGQSPRFRVVSLALGGTRLDMYASRDSRDACGSPAVHFALTRAPTTTRFPVVMTLPGCSIVRRDNGEIALLGPPLEELSGMRPTVTFDAVVLRALEILIGAHHSSRRARSGALAAGAA
jgi:hypothetical protein